MPIQKITSNIISGLANTSITGNIISSQITSVANTQITGNIISSQITSVANTQITGNIVASQITSIANTQITGLITTSQISSFPSVNRIINGGMAVDQRNSGSSQTITAAAALAYTVDRWYAYCTGANVTGQRVAGAYTSSQYRYQFTGAASVTAIGFGHRIEAANSFDLANTTATLSCYISNSLLTTVTWTAYYANSTDTFGSLASPTRTQIATGTFTVSSTRTQYTTNISIPSAATTGIEIVFSVGAQTSGTWIIDSVQLEKGSTASSFEFRNYVTELALCQRYYENGYNAMYSRCENPMGCWTAFKVTKRAAPTMAYSNFTTISSAGTLSLNGTSYGPTTDGFLVTINSSVGTNSGFYVQWAAAIEL